MKEKLVYIGSNIPDKTPAAVRVFANALALKKYGYDVKIISKDVEAVTDFDQNEGIDTWHLKRAKSTKEWILDLVEIKPYTRIIDQISNVKVIIAYELPFIAFLRLCRYCKRKGILLICETAEWQKWENLGHLGVVARIVRLADINMNMHYAYKKGDAIIVTSHYFAKYFKGYLPVLTLPTLQCHRPGIIWDNKINQPRKFIYAGGLGYEKDMLDEIIHAFSQLSGYDFEFNVLGLSKEQYTARFMDDTPIIESINQNTERIKFWGKVSHSEVLNELVRSDFSLIIRQSSHRNNVGFPTKYGESINCGTPVIVSDFSDVVYYTKLYNVGIITSVNNIADGIKKAINMSCDDLGSMSRRCRDCEAFFYEGNVNIIGNFVDTTIKTNQKK